MCIRDSTFAKAKQDGVAPVLEVALYEYGNDGIAAAEGHVRMVCALTTDLDKVSEQLFKLTTNGGEEYCGTVIQKAVNGLQWSTERDDYKAIFIAGNEPFTQGTVNYVDSCKLSIGKGIMVNTIHCGSEEEGIQGKWKDAALLADFAHAVTQAPVPGGHLEAPWQDLVPALRSPTAAVAAQEWDALFGGVGKPELFLYGSYHLAGFLNERPLAALRDDLARLGLTRDARRGETEDHVAFVFEVMRRPAEVSVGSIRVHKFSAFLREIVVPANFNVVGVKPLRGAGLVVCDPSLVFAVIDALFGGVGKFHTRIEGRDFSATELRVIRRLVDTIVAEYRKAWQGIYPLELEYQRSEMQPQFVNIASPRETGVLSLIHT